MHIPFERGLTRVRRDGNFVAVEIKRDINDVPAAFENLAAIERALDYTLTVLVMVNSPDTCAGQCPADIAPKTVCFAVQLENGKPVVRMQECG